MMVVVAIAGILASIAIPSVSDTIQRNRAREDSERVVAILSEARNRAHATLRCAATVVDPSAHTISYELYACSGAPSGTPTKTAAFPKLTLTTFSGGATSVTFTSGGGLAGGVNSEISATTAFGETTRLRIYPAIGQIEVVR